MTMQSTSHPDVRSLVPLREADRRAKNVNDVIRTNERTNKRCATTLINKNVCRPFARMYSSYPLRMHLILCWKLIGDNGVPWLTKEEEWSPANLCTTSSNARPLVPSHLRVKEESNDIYFMS